MLQNSMMPKNQKGVLIFAKGKTKSSKLSSAMKTEYSYEEKYRLFNYMLKKKKSNKTIIGDPIQDEDDQEFLHPSPTKLACSPSSSSIRSNCKIIKLIN